jgi:excisionase family DNA binding protein
MEKILLRPVEAADALAIARSRVYALIASGEIPSVRIGKSVRVPSAALSAWVRSLTENASDGDSRERVSDEA